MIKNILGRFLSILFFVFVSSLFSSHVNAQFSGNLGSISGSIKWGSQALNSTYVRWEGNTTGYSDSRNASDYNTGFTLPPDTYTVTASIVPLFGPQIVIGNQTVVVTAGQQSTNVNFDASTMSGLVKGSFKINGQIAGGKVQFCSPVVTDPCPFPISSGAEGPVYTIGSGIIGALLSGNYRVHATTSDNSLDAGIIPVTVVAGQIIEESSLQFAVGLGSISGSVKWGTLAIPGTSVFVEGASSGFTNSYTNTDFNTGFVLPPDTYTITASISPLFGPSTLVGSQTIVLTSGQTVSNINFDASSVTGLVYGNFKINGQIGSGKVQFCSPVATDPCPFPISGGAQGRIYSIGSGIIGALPPGDYRVHATTADNAYDAGIISITVIAGQSVEENSLQFAVNLGSISGSIKWGSQALNSTFVRWEGNTTGYSDSRQATDFNTGFTLPPDTYTITASIVPLFGPHIVIGNQVITVVGGQAITNVNFDASAATGLVTGSFKINGQISGGKVQFCSPVITDPCPFPISGGAEGPVYTIGSGIIGALLPGVYRVHATTSDNSLDAGIIPVTVTAGEIIDLALNTVGIPTGQNVSVSLGGITIIFSQVTTAGFMILSTTTHPQGGLPPSEYRFLGTYYELVTTASYSGPITVQFTYSDADVHGQESNLKLFHWDGSSWQNITIPPVDTVNNIITGSTPTLSPFVIAEPINSPPTVDAGGPYSVNEGGTINVSATGNDPESGILTYAWDLNGDGTFETQGQTVTLSGTGFDGPGTKSIAARVTDDGGLSATSQAIVTIVNVVPSVGIISAPIDPIQINTAVNASANFSDPGIDTHIGVWDWGDGTTSNAAINEINGSGSIAGSHTYTTPGVYSIRVTLTDKDGASSDSIFQYIVVYNQDGGYVTGGGWIDSPMGAYTISPLLTGKANFGFVSKYVHGATGPSGQTEFQFKVASFTFHSTSYEWLVIAGAHAKYKGSGTINGVGDYAFMLTATDGQVNGGGNIDKFRIKIWNKSTSQVVYDNQNGASDDADATMSVAGGSVVIHN